MIRTPFVIAAGFAVLLLTGPTHASETPELDPSFGEDGIVTSRLGKSESGLGRIRIQSDGKIVVGGFALDQYANDFALARYTSNGALDPEFGINGKTVFSVARSHDQINDIAIQPDGKIVVVGPARISYTDFIGLARLNPDGSLDESFSNDGIRIFSASKGEDTPNAVAIQEDGKILVAGVSHPSSAYPDFFLVRILPDGQIDETFGNRGFVFTDFALGSDRAKALAILPNGKILVSGSVYASSKSHLGFAQYLPDGSLDPAFGAQGKTIVPLSEHVRDPSELAILPDGRILVSCLGVANGYNDIDFAVVRFLPDGQIDGTFGNNGKTVTDMLGGNDWCNAMAVFPDGRILLAGHAFPPRGQSRGQRLALARYLPDGKPDPNFHDNGVAFLDIEKESGANNLAIQTDGNIIAAGKIAATPFVAAHKIFLLRILETSPLDVEASDEIHINLQTGLLEQTITVTNLASHSIYGFDLAIGKIPAGVKVWNASGHSDNGATVQFHQPLVGGASISFVIEYYTSIRNAQITPKISASPLLKPGLAPPAPDGGFAIDRVIRQRDGAMLVEFTAVPGVLYEVHYSPDAVHWKLSPVRIRAAGNRVQWIDRGPPRTDIPPGEASTRFYRIKTISEDN